MMKLKMKVVLWGREGSLKEIICNWICAQPRVAKRKSKGIVIFFAFASLIKIVENSFHWFFFYKPKTVS
jgi:hypothetical protein